MDSVVSAVPPAADHIPRDKVRLRFRKGGDLRFLSHHDLLRTFERMLRRAELPIRQTKGFHPKPRLVFALSLPLGVVGCEEVAELELDVVLPPEEVAARLARQAPPGLTVLSLKRVDPRAGAQVKRLCYRIALAPERADAIRARCAELMAAAEVLVERSRPPARHIDLRPILHDLQVVTGSDGTIHLEMDLNLTTAGTARPEELLQLLGAGDLVAAGAILERHRLELEDEADASPT